MEGDQKQEAAKELPIGTAKFVKPVTLAEVAYTHFQLREPTIDDMFDAELHLASSGRGVDTPLIFAAEMMLRQLIRVFNEGGQEFKGPFTMNMLKSFGTRNYSVIRRTQMEVELLGEG